MDVFLFVILFICVISFLGIAKFFTQPLFAFAAGLLILLLGLYVLLGGLTIQLPSETIIDNTNLQEHINRTPYFVQDGINNYSIVNETKYWVGETQETINYSTIELNEIQRTPFGLILILLGLAIVLQISIDFRSGFAARQPMEVEH